MIWFVWFNQTNLTDQINPALLTLSHTLRHDATGSGNAGKELQPFPLSFCRKRRRLIELLLACVVLIDLASYNTVAFVSSGAKRITPSWRKLSLSEGLFPDIYTVQFLLNRLQDEQE